ncbi:unnamed protein product [Pneumocystis jirovecii]|uniref:Chromatin associated protein KTI12 n=2 Tax=Pneumocystis jirovecii TaxID=42068 RepID=L0PHA7_PNEJI|nr:uncharacterized protein T551_03527 [Pneumocystis jirovecii RU7]KTW26227.1 hypothetical protein T551_03527 [Pneumocystis jirovecii RU7]CCJ31035.1 unnamed protein product [Pneumocystis jirovecii]
MPLIIFTGYPSSGKTQRALELKKALSDKINMDKRVPPFNLVLINDESLGIKKNVYGNATLEKTARATMYSAVERNLNKNTVILCDGMNYIKGYRYQLFCEAKNNATPHCVIHCGTPIDICREWNRSRGLLGYSQDIFEELVMRYEEPNSMVRWDSPLFTVFYSDEFCPVDRIWEIISSTKTIRPNASTVAKSVPASDYLFELDKATHEIINMIIQNQRINGPGSEVKVASINQNIILPSNVITLPKLQRIRHQFINLNRIQASNKNKIQENFVEFLNNQFK